ncbi:MAG: hypothetical protein ACOYI3_00285 [Christensenellales bacterium]|jgi:hypothetical protein
MNEFFTWGALGTYAGALLATTLFTQLFKGVSFLKKIPTRIFSYVIAFIVLVLSRLFTDGFDLSAVALCLINAAVVSLASNGAYDTACRLNGAGKSACPVATLTGTQQNAKQDEAKNEEK